MKYCMDCAHYRGKLSVKNREFLERLLQSYSPQLVLTSWVRLRQTRIPGGTRQDTDKIKAINIIKHGGLCRREHVHVYAIDQACAFYEPAEEEREC